MSDLCKLLDKIASDDATPAERAEAEAHAIECVTCARELAWQRREHALFAARRTRDVAPLWKDVEARIAAPPPRRQASWMAGLVAAAAAILLLVKSVPMALHHEAPHPVVVMPAAALVDPSRHADVEKRWQMPVRDGMRVAVYNVEGTISVQSAHRDDVLVTADHWPDLENAGWQIVVEQAGNTLSVRADCTHTCKAHPPVDIAVELPSARKLTLDIDSISADVELQALDLPVTAHTVSGEIHADASMLVRAKSTSGDVVVEHARSMSTELDSISGDVSWAGHCHKGCDVHVQTISGDVQMTPDNGSSYGTALVYADARPEVRKKGGPGVLGIATVSGDIEVADDDHDDDEDDDGVAIGAPTGGLVSRVAVGVGDEVQKGQVLVQLDAAAAGAELVAADGGRGKALVRTQTHGYVKAVLVHAGETVAPYAPVVTLSPKK